MASPTAIHRLRLQTGGTNAGLWDGYTEDNLNRLEEAISLRVALAVTGGTDTLTQTNYAADQSRSAFLDVSGTLASNETIEVPAIAHKWIIKNGTSGAFTTTIKVTAQTGVIIPQGTTAVVWCNGTDVFFAGPLVANSAGVFPSTWVEGADVASAADLDLLADGNVYNITGATGPITSIDTTGENHPVGSIVVTRFASTPTITHHATNLILLTGASITAAAGDFAQWEKYGAGTWRMVSYSRADGTPLAGGGTLSNISEDGTPQLGADLDANTFDILFDDATGIRDSADNEQLIFQETASAVTYLEITNQITATAPKLSSAGEANTSLLLETKGTGNFDFQTDDAVTPAALRMYDADNSAYVGIDAPSAVTTYTFTMPAAGGNANDMVVVDASNNSSFVPSPIGQQTFEVWASQLVDDDTSPPLSETVTTTSSGPFAVKSFDNAADEIAFFDVQMPVSYDDGTFVLQYLWTSGGAVTTGVAWSCAIASYGDNDDLDTDHFGSEVVVQDDHNGAINELNISPESAAITAGNSPAAGRLFRFRITRDVSDGNDDMTQDAHLILIRVHYTADTANDS